MAGISFLILLVLDGCFSFDFFGVFPGLSSSKFAAAAHVFFHMFLQLFVAQTYRNQHTINIYTHIKKWKALEKAKVTSVEVKALEKAKVKALEKAKVKALEKGQAEGCGKGDEGFGKGTGKGGARHFPKPYIDSGLLYKVLADNVLVLKNLGSYEHVSKANCPCPKGLVHTIGLWKSVLKLEPSGEVHPQPLRTALISLLAERPRAQLHLELWPGVG